MTTKEPKLWDNVVDLRPKSGINSLLTTEFFVDEARRAIEATKRWDAMTKLHELRKSCGVESKGTIMVRTPPRYFTPEAKPSPPKTFAAELPED